MGRGRREVQGGREENVIAGREVVVLSMAYSERRLKRVLERESIGRERKVRKKQKER